MYTRGNENDIDHCETVALRFDERRDRPGRRKVVKTLRVRRFDRH